MKKSVTAKHVFCIGIGGIGVSGLAELLHHQGIRVSGSDPTQNAQTKRLQSLGIQVFSDHQETNLADADLVVYSSAVSNDNPERLGAEKRGIRQITRGRLLAECSKDTTNIFVAGTHGKTTTSGIVAWMFEQATQDPTFVIGGVLRGRASTMQLGQSDYFIAESDESDASFLLLSPTVAVITNIDADHMETYDHDFERLKQSFLQFASQTAMNGFVIACIDNPVVRALAPSMSARVITYGESKDADYVLENFQQKGLQCEFDVKGHHFTLNLAGKHNALNALSAIAIADVYQLPLVKVQQALETFPGMNRRMQFHGELQLKTGVAMLFDDYGHHPTELAVTLKAAKAAFPGRRIVSVFQPHRFTRTRDLMAEFATELLLADYLVLTEVYAASEAKIAGADGLALYAALQKKGMQHISFVPELVDLPSALEKILQPDDVVILQGAGNIVKMATVLMEKFN